MTKCKRKSKTKHAKQRKMPNKTSKAKFQTEQK